MFGLFRKKLTIQVKSNNEQLSGFNDKNNRTLQLTCYKNERLSYTINNLNNYRGPKQQLRNFIIDNKRYSLEDLYNYRVRDNIIIYAI